MARKSKQSKADTAPAEGAPEPEAATKDVEAATPPPSDSEGERERVRKDLDESQRRADDLTTRLAYLQAELENQRKRAEREVEQVIRMANEGLVAQFLPLLDDLDAAVASVAGEAGKGFAMFRDNMLRVLAAAGLEEIPAAGAVFDPYLHECVQQVGDGTLKDGTVKEVVRKGYRYRMKVMRPAQVVVVNNGGETNA